MEIISVLMSTYKEPLEYVSKAVESILNQTFSDFKFVIMVDCPTNTPVIEYLSKLKEIDSRISVHINKQNMGLVKSLNMGLQYCNGKYIARMDADDISLPERFEKQLEFLENEKLDFVSGAYERFENEHKTGNILYFPKTFEECKKQLCLTNCMPHPAWFVKTEVYQSCKGYRDITGCEDYDFIIRAVENGFKIGNLPECVLRYRYHSESISRKGIAEQNAVTHFLAENFKKNRSTDIVEYENYLKSKKCKKYILSVERLQSRRKRYKSQSNPVLKAVFKLPVIFSRQFIKQKTNELLFYNRIMKQ